MPTERFFRLPREKAEAIRNAAFQEFMRVPPEEASINRIIRAAEISRGSFYTYFTDKYELLTWLISDQIKNHMRFYVQWLKKTNGDIWEVFEHALDYTMVQINERGFIGIIRNMIKSNSFSEFFKAGMEADAISCDINKRYMEWMYENCDKTKCPLDLTGFCDLFDMHRIILMMAMKEFLNDCASCEEAASAYKRRMRLLRYGVCPAEKGQKETRERKVSGKEET
ncbi:MAG: TetR/AcrR family transcriptional regulator [Lachnospiraceae bacterium]|jgi:hypothetical protein|nr:TetR/AcrR family transcriptional regulator [Lachnospiraceae bacterium]NBK05223.1 TetR/AcrR family transcriptional regulator [bacterium 1XD42-94]